MMKYHSSKPENTAGSRFPARPSWLKWAVLAVLPMALVFAAGADEDEERVVIRSKVRNCPKVKIADGEDIQFLNLSKRGFLGVEVTALSPELRQHFGVSDGEGVMISRVVDDSAARAAALQVGDIITHIDGESIDTSWALGKAIREHEGGDAIAVEYVRDSRSSTTTAVLSAHETCAFDVGHFFEGVDWEEFSQMGAQIGQDALRSIDWEEIGKMGAVISEEALASALESLQGVNFNGKLEKAIEKELEGLEVLEFSNLEERMEEVQERLEELELQLERELEEVEHKHERIERQRERNEERMERERDRAEERRERERERQEEEQEDAEESREAELERENLANGTTV